jgi:hypothetical protein
MHAAQIAAWLAPEGLQIKMNATLLAARNWLNLFLIENRPLDEALAMIQEQVVVAEVLVQGDMQNATYLQRLGNAKCGLGMIQRDLKKAGWEEAIRSGLIHIQKAVKIEARNHDYPKEVEGCGENTLLGNSRLMAARRKSGRSTGSL